MAAYTDSVIRGLLLEEAILFILSKTGYRPVFKKGADPSLHDGAAGLEVYGRGARHQIDAVADLEYTPPFCNQQRLLIEAKFKNSKTGIDIIRNAAGVHKDVSEYWVVDSINGMRISRKRFHYLYAIFSKEPFTKPAQDYAYAQDIFLLPLKRNSLFSPIIDAIDAVSFRDVLYKPSLKQVRSYVRQLLFQNIGPESSEAGLHEQVVIAESPASYELDAFISACCQAGFGFIAMLDGNFPVFLTANRNLMLADFESTNKVRIKVENNHWFLEDRSGQKIFSFDLPEELYERYQESGSLSRRGILGMKKRHMSEFYVLVSGLEGLRLVRFVLDRGWIRDVERELEN